MMPSSREYGASFSPTQIHPVLSPQRLTFSDVNSGTPSSNFTLTSDPQSPRLETTAHLSADISYNAPPVAATAGCPNSTPEPTHSEQARIATPDHTSRPDATSLGPTAPSSESLSLLPQKQPSFREHRRVKHRKNAYSIDSVPRQTLLKALQSSRPLPASMDALIMAGKQEGSNAATPSSQSGPVAAFSNLSIDPGAALAGKAAALSSPFFMHKKFDNSVNFTKVVEEARESHSRLMQTATSVREVSRQLQRHPVKMTVRNIMIVTKARDNDLVCLTRELAEWLLTTPRNGSDLGVNVYVDHKLRRSKRFDTQSLLDKDPRIENMLRFWTPEMCWTSPEQFDLVLTLGGDGTVLFTSWLFQQIVPPVLSFSLGSLGFLTNFEFSQYKESLGKIMDNNEMRVNIRMRFTCTVYRYQKHGGPDAPEYIEAEQFEVLNELVIDRGPSPYVSNLELYGDDNLITVVQADGCIFSTPTGSTAYSLSAGGALVHPDIPAILLTPICPHTLSFRPMLLTDSMLLRVAVPRHSRATAYCAFDGKGRVELRQGDHVTVAASQYPFPSVVSKPMEWFDSISRTLRWNNRGAQQKAWDGDAKEGEVGEAETRFDIDFDDDAVDSGYSAESSTVGGHDSPIRKGVIYPFP